MYQSKKNSLNFHSIFTNQFILRKRKLFEIFYKRIKIFRTPVFLVNNAKSNQGASRNVYFVS